MPILEKKREPASPVAAYGAMELAETGTSAGQEGFSRGSFALFPLCSNPECRAGRFRLWRSRQTPVLEGGWLCSVECTRSRLRRFMAREMEGRSEEPVTHRHRVPLGLVMLAQGWISQAQLRSALRAQKESGRGRLGDWLVEQCGLDEQLVTRALGVQWNCPVFSLDGHQPELVSALVPRLFIDSFGLVPVRGTHSRSLHVGFEDRLNPCVTFAIERMTGLRVIAGLLSGADFRRAHPRMLAGAFPKTRLIEAANLEHLVRAMSTVLEEAKAVEARLVRVHDFFWLRMWRTTPAGPIPRREDVEDVIGSLMRAG